MEAVGSPEALFLILLIQEAGIYVPLPGNWLMAFAGVRAAEGAMSAPLALLAGVAATILGATALYWLARRGGRPLVDRHGHRFGLTQSRLARVELALVRWGLLAVFVGRLVPGVRCGSSFAAGLLGVRFAPFLAATAASAFVWWGFWLWLGWSLGPALLQRFDATSGQFLAVVALVSLAGTALVLARALVRYVGWSGVRRSAASLLSLSRIVASTRSR
jgi:membrane protein DedA with SNARE-associated domain